MCVWINQLFVNETVTFLREPVLFSLAAEIFPFLHSILHELTPRGTPHSSSTMSDTDSSSEVCYIDYRVRVCVQFCCNLLAKYYVSSLGILLVQDEALFQMGTVRNLKGRLKSIDEGDDDVIPQYEKPNYATAVEYWNTLLPRRIKDSSQPSGYRQALVGELFDENGEPAELYDFWKTDSGALDEFGIGMSLYFRTLKMMGIICFVCALILLVAVDENKKNQENTGIWGDVGSDYEEDRIGTW
jgi:hypothetical protein